jgi:2'-5' RNA ligase
MLDYHYRKSTKVSKPTNLTGHVTLKFVSHVTLKFIGDTYSTNLTVV